MSKAMHCALPKEQGGGEEECWRVWDISRRGMLRPPLVKAAEEIREMVQHLRRRFSFYLTSDWNNQPYIMSSV